VGKKIVEMPKKAKEEKKKKEKHRAPYLNFHEFLNRVLSA